MKSISRSTLLFFVSLALLAYLIKCALGGGDFRIFLEASQLFRDHKSMYDVWLPAANGAACLYYYSPMFTLLLVPFSYMPFFIPSLIWLLMCLFFLYRIWVLVSSGFDLNSLNKKHINLMLLFTFLITVRFIEYNLGMVQMTIYLAWSILESLRFFRSGKNISGGIVLALAINIKILPLVILPYLIYRSHWKGLLSTIFFIFVFLELPALYVGWQFNHHLLLEWWKMINPSNSEHLLETDLIMHSLTALIPPLLHDTGGDLPLKRNIMNLDLPMVIVVLNIVRFMFVAFTLYFLRSKPFAKANSPLHEVWEISYIMMIIPLIFPHQPKYAGFLILPAVLYIFYFLFSVKSRTGNIFGKYKMIVAITLVVLSFVLITLTTDGLIGRDLNRISQHYKTITYGMLLLCCTLALCKPEYLNVSETESK